MENYWKGRTRTLIAPKKGQYRLPDSRDERMSKLFAMLENLVMWVKKQHPDLTDDSIRLILKGEDDVVNP